MTYAIKNPSEDSSQINVQNADSLKKINNKLISADLINKIDTRPLANPNTNYSYSQNN